MADRGKKTRHDGIYKMKDGRWLLQVVLRVGGKRKTVEQRLPAHVLERDAVAERAQMLHAAVAARDGTPPPTPPAAPPKAVKARAVTTRPQPKPWWQEIPAAATPTGTIADYATRWIVRKKSEIRPRTVEDYAKTLACHILPRLGEIPVAMLNRQHLLEWREWAQVQRKPGKRPYSSATLAVWWRVLRVMISDLVADFGLNPSITYRIKPPKSDGARVRTNAALTAAQLRTLLATVKAQFPAWYAEVLVTAYAGMRPSELYALTWEDIDLDGGKLIISKSIVNGHVNRPKNGHTRIVALTGEMVRVLRAHRTAKPGLGAVRVFPTVDGKARGDTTLYHLLVDAGKAAGIPFTVGPQVLRYTANTLLREAGVADEIVRERLGHTTREMGQRYFKGHLDAQRNAVEALALEVEGGGPDRQAVG